MQGSQGHLFHHLSYKSDPGCLFVTSDAVKPVTACQCAGSLSQTRDKSGGFELYFNQIHQIQGANTNVTFAISKYKYFMCVCMHACVRA